MPDRNPLCTCVLLPNRAESDRWRNTRGPHYERLIEAVVVRRPTPGTIDGKVIPTEFNARPAHGPRGAFPGRPARRRVLGPNGTVITPDGNVVGESTWPRRYLPQERAWIALALPRCRDLVGRYYTIASPHWSGYYHWLTEVLPRLFALDTLPNDDIRVLINTR